MDMLKDQIFIHPTAKIAANVEIGPWSYIGENVEIGEGTIVNPHVVIKGPTKIGKNNKIFQFASVGEEAQDKKFFGEATYLEIGDGNTIRENVTINRGTKVGGGITKIGNNNWIMANVHIAHDCIIGNNTIFANYSALAGHVTVEDYVVMSGYAAIHQFCTIGAYSFVAKATYITKDVLPFILVSGYDAVAKGLNLEGLKRQGFSPEKISCLKKAYKIIYRQGLTVKEAISELNKLLPECQEVELLLTGLQHSKRGIIR